MKDEENGEEIEERDEILEEIYKMIEDDGIMDRKEIETLERLIEYRVNAMLDYIVEIEISRVRDRIANVISVHGHDSLGKAVVPIEDLITR